MTLKRISKNSRHAFPLASLRPAFTLAIQSDQCVSSPITEKCVLVLLRRLRSHLANKGSRERIGVRSSGERIRRRLLVRRRREERNRFLHLLIWLSVCVECTCVESWMKFLFISKGDSAMNTPPCCTFAYIVRCDALLHSFWDIVPSSFFLTWGPVTSVPGPVSDITTVHNTTAEDP